MNDEYDDEEEEDLMNQRLSPLHNPFNQQQTPSLALKAPDQLSKEAEEIETEMNYIDCIIWAITAMNETEIQDMVGGDCLNGISVKPMSYKSLSEILFAYGLISTLEKKSWANIYSKHSWSIPHWLSSFFEKSQYLLLDYLLSFAAYPVCPAKRLHSVYLVFILTDKQF